MLDSVKPDYLELTSHVEAVEVSFRIAVAHSLIGGFDGVLLTRVRSVKKHWFVR